MNVRLVHEFRFEAAHRLPRVPAGHKCARLHGHSYIAEVAVSGEVEAATGVPEEGMVCDFADLKEIWKHKCEPWLDHQFLNDTLPVPVTTAEWIALWIHGIFAAEVELVRDDIGIDLHYVKVWETASSYACVSQPRAADKFLRLPSPKS